MDKLINVNKTKPKRTRWESNIDDSESTSRTVEFGSDPHVFDFETANIFLTGVIFTILGKASNDLEKYQIIEAVESGLPYSPCSAELISNLENSTQVNQLFCVTFTSSLFSLICLKLNGLIITSQNIKLLCRRPARYSNLDSDKALDRFIIPRIKQLDSFKENAKCILKNLPTDINEEKIRQQLENIGKLKYLTIICDPITGIQKGVGSFEFEEGSLCKKAIALLHGKPIESTKSGIWNIYLGSGIIANSNSNNSQSNSSNFSVNSSAIQNSEYLHISEIPTSMTYSVFSIPVLGLMMKYSKQIGETPSQIIQLLNIFLPEELIDDEIYNSTLDSIRSEAEVYGTILEIFCPRPKVIGEFHNYSGAGKVFIYFSDITAARRAQYQFNGRVFDSIKTVSATFYPLEKYLKHEYNIISYCNEDQKLS
ncbi:U2 snRNP auxiliary factor or splicing factor [Cryptosporidium sp. chipmunk genotype I]|uniref:U2 snRNP auxiliary factor or splicing factor n=1 Tax=Cryptosporidium sp. chipmunk genotype I TaxID=1280935 RepID=UPI00351A0FE2|nr:U2 snRNP auxiliary factor or splicing factor [Cryptosporidium sp. chipmunk genotype I]